MMDEHVKRRRTTESGSNAILDSCVVVRNSKEIHQHSRDDNIEFKEEGHVYILYPNTPFQETFPISVSGLYSQYFEEFNPREVIALYFQRWKDTPSSKYYRCICEGRRVGLCDVQIAESIRLGWAWKGLLASTAGTRMHKNIELALGGMAYNTDLVESQVFVEARGQWQQCQKCQKASELEEMQLSCHWQVWIEDRLDRGQ